MACGLLFLLLFTACVLATTDQHRVPPPTPRSLGTLQRSIFSPPLTDVPNFKQDSTFQSTLLRRANKQTTTSHPSSHTIELIGPGDSKTYSHKRTVEVSVPAAPDSVPIFFFGPPSSGLLTAANTQSQWNGERDILSMMSEVRIAASLAKAHGSAHRAEIYAPSPNIAHRTVEVVRQRLPKTRVMGRVYTDTDLVNTRSYWSFDVEVGSEEVVETWHSDRVHEFEPPMSREVEVVEPKGKVWTRRGGRR